MKYFLQGLTETLYSKTQAASSRKRKEFVPKTLDDLGTETSCDLSLIAPHLELLYYCTLIGREIRSVATPDLLSHK